MPNPKELLIKRGVYTALLAIGLLTSLDSGFNYVQQEANKPGNLSSADVAGLLLNTQERKLTTAEYNFIVGALGPSLTRDSLQKIMEMSIQCSKEPFFNHLSFIGLPVFKKNGELLRFILYGIACGAPNEPDYVTSGIEVHVSPLASQILRLSSEEVTNTLDQPNPSAPGDDLSANFGTENTYVLMSTYLIKDSGVGDPQGWLAGAATQGNYADNKNTVKFTQLLTNDEFEAEVAEVLFDPQIGLCGFMPLYIARQVDSNSPTEVEQDIDPPNEDIYHLKLCSIALTGVASESFRFDLNALPSNVREYILNNNMISPQNFPLDAAIEKHIEVTLKGTNLGNTTEVIYGTHATSLTMAYNQTQKNNIPNTNPRFPVELPVGVVLASVGAIGLGTELRKKKNGPPLSEEEKISRQRDELRQRLQKNQQTNQAKQPEQKPIEPYVPPVKKKEIFSFNTTTSNGEPTMITTPDEGFTYIDSLISDPDAKERFNASYYEVHSLLTLIMETKEDFGPIQTFLKERKDRIESWDIGGDSIVVRYQINDKRKQPVGYVLIDTNLEERPFKATFYKEVPTPITVQDERKHQAAEMSFEETIGEHEVHNVQEAAELIATAILNLMITTHLNEEAFTIVQKECQALAERNKTYSQVKEEVKRLLTEYIQTNQIPIYVGNDKRAMRNIRLHPKILADRIYDYFVESKTSESNYDAFTQEAINILDKEGGTVLRNTASKEWDTRTGFRIQSIKIIKDGALSIMVLFTDNSH